MYCPPSGTVQSTTSPGPHTLPRRPCQCRIVLGTPGSLPRTPHPDLKVSAPWAELEIYELDFKLVQVQSQLNSSCHSDLCRFFMPGSRLGDEWMLKLPSKGFFASCLGEPRDSPAEGGSEGVLECRRVAPHGRGLSVPPGLEESTDPNAWTQAGHVATSGAMRALGGALQTPAVAQAFSSTIHSGNSLSSAVLTGAWGQQMF